MFPHETEDRRITMEIAWCPDCRADCLVEVFTVAGDPSPVAVCVDCGLGVETYWSPGLTGHPRPGVAKAS